MKLLIVIALSLFAGGQCLRSSHPDAEAQPDRTVTLAAGDAPEDPLLAGVMVERDRCQNDLAAARAAAADCEPVTKLRTKVVEKPAKKCAVPPPVVQPVVTTPCAEGLTCLDSKAQAALIANMAAYESYVQRVETDCK
jgi:hypothetical protein